MPEPFQNPPDPSNPSLNPERWVDDHGDALFSFAMLQVRDRREAEDIVQETFVAALGARERFSGQSSVRTWLIGILKHKVADHLRKARRQEERLDLDQADPVWENWFSPRGFWAEKPSRWRRRPDELVEDREFWKVLSDCIHKLPRRLAEVFCLKEISEMSSEDVCKTAEVTATNLWTMLHRARMRLRACLDTNWFGRGDD